MKNKLKNIVKGGIFTALSFGIIVAFTYKEIVHNILSHHPTWQTNQELIKGLPKLLFSRGDYNGIPNSADCLPEGTDLNAIYLGKQKNSFQKSPYSPTSASIPKNVILYNPSCMINLKFNSKSLEKTSMSMLTKIKEMKKGEIISLKEEGNQNDRYSWNYGEGLIDMMEGGPIEGFGNFTLSLGYDNQGKYLSFFDIFDFKVGNGGYFDNNETSIREKIGGKILSKIGNPIYFYKREYFNEIGITDKLIEKTLENKLK